MTNQVLTPQSDITIKYDPVYLPHFTDFIYFFVGSHLVVPLMERFSYPPHHHTIFLSMLILLFSQVSPWMRRNSFLVPSTCLSPHQPSGI